MLLCSFPCPGSCVQPYAFVVGVRARFLVALPASSYLFVAVLEPQDFLLTMRAYRGLVPKVDRVWLASCLKLVQEEDKHTHALSVGRHGGAKPTSAVSRTPVSALQRRRITQGPPYKCPVIREQLWDWFVDIRASIAGAVSPKFVLMKARQIATDVLEIQRKVGGFATMPRLDRNWLFRWKRDKGVVFRSPNLRFKCSRPVLLARLRAMWLNLIRVRRLAQRLLGTCLGNAIYGIDEKPIHFNESGSKSVRTLEIVGAPLVRLKENHAATRERASVMTTVASCPLVASQPRLLPIEVLFKAGSNKRTRGLVLRADRNVSVQWAEKGSYRNAHILRFLDRWLEPWTPEREAAQDYRILFMDVASSHISDEVVDFCWSRGYLVLNHYGCTTGVAQVNDTDCHGDFEREYIEFEQAAFNHQQLVRPGCVARRPQEVLDDVVATWSVLDHTKGASGHKRNGLSIALDGSEDHRISRIALECWEAVGMAEERRKAIAEVDALVDKGELEWANWRAVVRHPVDPGVQEEGYEAEGALAAGEKPWVTDAEAAEQALDDAACLAMGEPGGKRAVAEVDEVVALPGDDPADVHTANIAVARLKKLKDMRAELKGTKIPAAIFHVDREITQLSRGTRSKDAAGKKAQEVLRRHLAARNAAEAAKLTGLRAKYRREDKNRRLVRAKIAKAKAAKEKSKAAKKTLQAKLALLPKTFTKADLQQPGPKGTKARAELLERLKLRSPKLPFAEETRWPDLKRAFAAAFPKLYSHKAIGHQFSELINHTLEKLKEHAIGPTAFNKAGAVGGDPTAFMKLFRKMEKKVPAPVGAVTL